MRRILGSKILIITLSLMPTSSFANNFNFENNYTQANENMELKKIKEYIDKNLIPNNSTFCIDNICYYYDCQGNYYVYKNGWIKLENTFENSLSNPILLNEYIKKNNINPYPYFCFNGNWYRYTNNEFQYLKNGYWQKLENSINKNISVINNELIKIKEYINKNLQENNNAFQISGIWYYYSCNGKYYYYNKQNKWVEIENTRENETVRPEILIKYIAKYSINTNDSFCFNGNWYYYNNGGYKFYRNGNWFILK